MPRHYYNTQKRYNMKSNLAICKLIKYAEKYLGLHPADVNYKVNTILDLLNISYFEQVPVEYVTTDIAELLSEFTSACVEDGIFEQQDGPYYCDKVMGALSILPSSVDGVFHQIYAEHGSKIAMEWLYGYCVANNYIKKAVLDKNPRFDSNGLVVTINLAKPEFRDPKQSAQGNKVQGGYPKCVICRENEGVVSRSKCTLRTVSLTLGGKPWFWQFSPYGYFREHGIAVNTIHTPMKVDKQTFVNILDFVDQFPSYFIGSNAALKRIGGSVLAHDHYQGGGEILPMHKVGFRQMFTMDGYEDLQIGIVDWHNTAVRICGTNRDKIVELATRINDAWNVYTNEELGLIPFTDGEQHHATSPTVVKKGNTYELTIILRSNITTEQYPDGVFHAHPEFHIIKKESIGLIEAQGLFILPGRLQKQLADVEKCIANGLLTDDLKDFQMVYDETLAIVNKGVGNIHKAMEMELGSICERILKNTAVFKDDSQTVAFMQGLGFQLK